MTYHAANSPRCTGATGPIELIIEPQQRDLGELTVRRALPSPQRNMVGPFIFFDHMGPAEFPPGFGMQVRPHPHIGIATITYLFEGQIVHRDSLGFVQPIDAAAVNLMTAGRGIVHSERAGEDLDVMSRLHGIQSWIALPKEHEECAPDFVHYPAADIPAFSVDGVRGRVIIGTAHDVTSPVVALSPTIYLEYRLGHGAELTLPEGYAEVAAYVVAGRVEIGGQRFGAGTMAVTGAPGLALRADEDSHVMVLGGDPVGDRHIWWNFVSSSRARMEKAKADWKDGRFEAVPGDDEFIPLPE